MSHSYRIVYIVTIIVIFCTLICSTGAFAATPTVSWNKTYQIAGNTYTEAFIPAGDGYLVGGRYFSGDMEMGVFLMKTDCYGNMVWNRTYDYLKDISSMIAVDDGYVVTGTTSKYMKTNPEFVGKSWYSYLAKFDLDGNLIWQSNFSMVSTSESLVPVSEGYVIAGKIGTHTIAKGSMNGFLAMTDMNGREIWNRTYGYPRYDDYMNKTFSNNFDTYFYAIQPSGNGYVMAGQTHGAVSWINGTTWLLKTDRDGNEIWNRTYGEGYFTAMANASDGYVLFMDSASGSHVMKTDMDGNKLWERDLSFSGIQSMALAPDGYLLTGETHNTVLQDYHICLSKIDRSGNMVWNITYPLAGSYYDNMVVFDNGAYVIAGTYKTNATAYNTSIFILKTRQDDKGVTPTTQATPASNMLLSMLAMIVAIIAARSQK